MMKLLVTKTNVLFFSRIYLLLVLAIFLACNNDNVKSIDLNLVKLKIPENWKTFNEIGIDSKSGFIITPQNDTIKYSYGKHIAKFRIDSKVYHDTLKNEFKNFESRDVFTPFFSNTPEYDNALGVYLKEYYYYELINNKKALFKVPKKKGKGVTGLYIENIKGDNKLLIWGKNLRPKSTEYLLESFSSISWK